MNFSIIIPAKNEELNIGRCLDSILSLEWQRCDYEIIVVDNGSSDQTVPIAESKGARVFILPDITISGLRNFGAMQAQGNLLAFIDADCTVAKDWLHSAARYLSKKEIVCFGSPPVLPENSTWVQRAWFPIRFKNLYGEDTDWLESMNMFVRREAFETVRGFNENLITCEDYDLSLRLRSLGRLVCDAGIIAVHHGEASSVGHFYRKEFWRGTSNFHGLMHHGFSWQELPSVVLPLCYVVSSAMVIGGLAIALLTFSKQSLLMAVVFLIVWQMALILLAFRKAGNGFFSKLTMQLYFLLNIYFMARGGAMFQRFRG